MPNRIAILFLLLSNFLLAQIPSKPSNYLTDDASVLNSAQEASINKKLNTFENTSGIQTFVYIAKSLNGSNMEMYCQDLFTNWQIGEKGKDNGILIAIFINDHKFRIHTGYGIEGKLPDLLTKKIQDENMRPYFKESKYYEGLLEGIDKIIYYSSHTYIPEARVETEHTKKKTNWSPYLLALSPFLF